MKRLTLEEISNLPKGSVIWREEQDEIEPMLVCVAGKNGIVAWADHNSELILDINADLITDTRFFWDQEPTKNQTAK